MVKKSVDIPLSIFNIIVYHIMLPIMTGLILARCLRTIPVNDVFSLIPEFMNGHTVFAIDNIDSCETIDTCILSANKLLKSNVVSAIAFQSFSSMNSGWTKFEIIFLTYLVISFIILIVSSVYTKFCHNNSTPQLITVLLYLGQVLITFIFMIVIIVLQWKISTNETKIILTVFTTCVVIPLLGTILLQYNIYNRLKSHYREDGYDSIWDESISPGS